MEKKYTPMMRQYLDVKENYKDALVFYRLGDFYEMFFDDAKIASSALDLVLTKRNGGVEEKIPMCGVPHHAVNSYIQRLVALGHKVAMVEQLETPSEAVGIVKRDVVKIITPGTLMDDSLDEKNAIRIASIVDYQYGYAISLLDMSTGECIALRIKSEKLGLLQTMLKNNVREIVVVNDFNPKIIDSIRNLGSITISYCDKNDIDENYLELCNHIKDVNVLNSYGKLINYCLATSKQMLSHLQILKLEDSNQYMAMDYSTITNLELIAPLRAVGKSNTLWGYLDKCQSSMGSRMLKKVISEPLVIEDEINQRLDKVEVMVNNYNLRMDLKNALSQIYDLQRCIAKIAYKSVNAIDLVRLLKTLKQVPIIMNYLSEHEQFKELIKIDYCSDLCDLLDNALLENPAVSLKDGNLFKDNYDEKLDELKLLATDSKQWILNQENIEREKTGIKTLKIGYNRVFGYYIEVSKGQVPMVKEEYGYIRKQTLSNNERYITAQLKEKEDTILNSFDRALKLEYQLFIDLVVSIQKYLPKLHKIANNLAYIDVLYALSVTSANNHYCRPIFSDDKLEIIEGKHPMLCESKEINYVSNNCYMDHDKSILIITGPNMGGKSTYMRQIALNVIMAQIGCYTACDSCITPIFDKLFTRLGASDDILSGQSTFMVEMNEANYALSNATNKSLILFDEIGRGTSTYDGMSIAMSMIEYISVKIKAKTLFSTHYHEITQLEDSLDNVKNVNVLVKNNDGDISFMYRIVEGKANQSYGINVAKLANLPDAIINRSNELLAQFESEKKVVQQSFGMFVNETVVDENAVDLKQMIKQIDPNKLTPIEALNALYDLKSMLK